ncbi:MAG: glycosyltransferase family 2 protein [Rhodospirillaceae bacterium]
MTSTQNQPERVCGRYTVYPDITGLRLDAGGLRTKGLVKQGAPGRPLVSVVTPVFNCAEALERCLASVGGQTYANVEHIVVDGGSTDGSLDILRSRADRLDYFVSEPDGGIYPAMNKGLELAKGDFVCILNADDYYGPDFVAQMVAAQPDDTSVGYGDPFVDGVRYEADLTIAAFLTLFYVNHSTFLVPRKIYDLVGPYDETFKLVSDAFWIWRALTMGVPFHKVPDCQFYFHTGGASTSDTPKKWAFNLSERGNSIRRVWPFLSWSESHALSRIRWDKRLLPVIVEILERHHSKSPLLGEAVAEILRVCLRRYWTFERQGEGAEALLTAVRKLCDLLNLPADAVRVVPSGTTDGDEGATATPQQPVWPYVMLSQTQNLNLWERVDGIEPERVLLARRLFDIMLVNLEWSTGISRCPIEELLRRTGAVEKDILAALEVLRDLAAIEDCNRAAAAEGIYRLNPRLVWQGNIDERPAVVQAFRAHTPQAAAAARGHGVGHGSTRQPTEVG